MSDFESKRIASGYSSSDTEPAAQRTDAAYMAWREIRESSVADFVNHIKDLCVS